MTLTETQIRDRIRATRQQIAPKTDRIRYALADARLAEAENLSRLLEETGA